MSYVGSANPFDLLDDSKPQRKAQEKPKAAAAAPAKKDTRRNNKTRDNKDRRNKGGDAARGRKFDRRSGTGRGKEVSKGGHGRGGWDSDKNEVRRARRARQNGDDAEAQEPVAEEVKDDSAAADADAAEQDDEPATLSLDEYRAKVGTLAADEHKDRREVAVDDSRWKAVGELVEVDDDDMYNIKVTTGKKKRNKKKNKRPMSLDEFAAASSRGRGGRGNRGGRNGDRRQGRSRNSRNVDLRDNSAFPTLGGK